MNIFAIGIGGVGSSIVGEIVKEHERTKNRFQQIDQTINLDYTLIDYPSGIDKLNWSPNPTNTISFYYPEKEWLLNNVDEHFPADEFLMIPPDSSAGRSRSLSKGLFEYNKDRILAHLSRQLIDFCDDKSSVAIWIFTSFGGSTGSGMFIDLSIQLNKEVTSKLKDAGVRCSIYLVGVLPAAAINGDDANSAINFVQAFKELTYALNVENIKFADEIFVVGLEQNIGDLEKTGLMMDSMIAKCITDYCCGVTDFDDVLTEIEQHEAGLKSGKFLSMSMKSYNFPMEEILERHESEIECNDLQKEARDLENKLKTCEHNISKYKNNINNLGYQVEELYENITAIKVKKRVNFLNRRKIKKYENNLIVFEKQISEEKELMRPLEIEIKKTNDKLKSIVEQINLLIKKIYKLKIKLESQSSDGIFSKETIGNDQYIEIIKNLELLKEKSLSEIYEMINRDNFRRFLEKMKCDLIESIPLLLSRNEAIPFLELGYAVPEDVLLDIPIENLFQQHPFVETMMPRDILFKNNYEVNLYGIFAGIEINMINDFKLMGFIDEFEKIPSDIIDQSFAAYLYGKKWSEYNPDWLLHNI